MEKGGSVGRTRPHSAQGLAVPGRLAGPCGCHTLPGPGSHCCWPGWVLAGLAAASRAQSRALRGRSRDLECLEPCPSRCHGEHPGPRPGEHGAPHAAQPKSPARPGAAPNTQHLPFTVFTSLEGGCDCRQEAELPDCWGGGRHRGICSRARTSSCARLRPWSSVPPEGPGASLSRGQGSPAALWHLTSSPSPPQSSYPIWEDFNSKATKLHSQLR